MLRTRLFALLTVVVLAGGLAGCNRGKEATVPKATTTTQPSTTAPTIAADEYSFTVLGTLTADRTAITMKNDGDELHVWQFAKLREGADISQAAAAIESGPGGGTTTTTSATDDRTTTSRASRSGVRGAQATTTTEPTTTTTEPPATTTTPPTTATPTSPPTTRRTTTTVRRTTTTIRRTTTTRRSGTTTSSVPGGDVTDIFENPDLGAPSSLLSPGESNTVTADLDAGRYAVMCFIKAADGVSHLSKGMIAEVQVEEAPEPPPDPPVDRTVTITDGRIDVGAKDFKAAKTTFEVTNGGDKKHDFSIVSLNEGETLRSLSRYIQAAFEGPPPATAPGKIIASVSTIEPGERVKVSLDLKPGTYTVACTYSDEEANEDHLSAFGEQTTITVT